MLVDLLDECLSNPRYKVQSKSILYAKDIPDYSTETHANEDRSLSLKLIKSTGTLLVVETNKYKATEIMKLAFVQGDAETCNSYLGSRLELTVKALVTEKAIVVGLKEDLQRASEHGVAMQCELSELR